MKNEPQTGKTFRRCVALVLLLVAAWLGYVVLSLQALPAGLGEQVDGEMGNSGVSNPVTAVLLNFRGYDTLLEMAVLLLALLGVWSLDAPRRKDERFPGAVLDMLSRLLTPVLLLVAGYLLWAGADAPGGAFQAGSVLAAAGVLLILSGWRPDQGLSSALLRVALVLGLGVFLLTGTALLLRGSFLEYPAAQAGGLILLIESAATLSIGVTLAALFLGDRPGAERER